jgi:hypothetical protein
MGGEGSRPRARAKSALRGLTWGYGGQRPGSSLLEPPVGALQGVSKGDADLLKHAFNIKAVGDLGKNKYFRAAQLLTQLAEAGAK